MFFVLLMVSFLMKSQEWTQDKIETQVIFKIKNLGINVAGHFNEVAIQSNFDIDELSKSYIEALIEVKSIETGMSGRDKHLLKEDFFDENRVKNIRLKSTSFRKEKNGSIFLIGGLTIKKTTKKIEIPIQVLQEENKLKISADFTLNRKDFDVGGGSFILSKNVNIHVEYNATR